jgi:hypothetical protein
MRESPSITLGQPMSASKGEEIAPEAVALQTCQAFGKSYIQVKIQSSLTRRSPLNRVSRIRQLSVQELSRRGNYSAGLLTGDDSGTGAALSWASARSTSLAALTHGPRLFRMIISLRIEAGVLSF